MTEIAAGRLIDALASFVELRDTVERAAFSVTNSLNARYDALGDSCATQAHRHLSDVAKIANSIRASLSTPRETCCGHADLARVTAERDRALAIIETYETAGGPREEEQRNFGADQAALGLLRVATHPRKYPGTFGGASMQACAAAIEAIKADLDAARSALAEANSTLAHFSLRSGERCAGTHSTREALKAALRYSVDLNPTTDFASPESVYQGLQPMLASVVGTYRDFAKEALRASEKDEVALEGAEKNRDHALNSKNAALDALQRARKERDEWRSEVVWGSTKERSLADAHAAGRREGILAAAKAAMLGRANLAGRSAAHIDAVKAIHSLLSEPNPRVADSQPLDHEWGYEGTRGPKGAGPFKCRKCGITVAVLTPLTPACAPEASLVGEGRRICPCGTKLDGDEDCPLCESPSRAISIPTAWEEGAKG